MTRRKTVAQLVREADPNDPDALRIPGRGTAAGFRRVQEAERAAEEAAKARRAQKKPMGKRHRRECMQEAQWEFWTNFPALVKAAIEAAKKGRTVQLKMLLELGGLEAGSMAKTLTSTKPKGLADMLMAEVRRGREKAAQDTADGVKDAASEARRGRKEDKPGEETGGGADGV